MEIIIAENGKIFLKNPPELFSLEEQLLYLKKAQSGDRIAEKEVIERCLQLVLSRISKYYNSVYDKEDLFSIGSIGVIKAIRNFDLSREIAFSTYAARCIDNEILMFLRKERQKQREVSISAVVSHDSEGKEITFEQVMESDCNLEEMYLEKEEKKDVIETLKSLPENEKDMIINYYFKEKSQEKISKELGVSQSYVSRLIKKSTKSFKNKMEQQEKVPILQKKR